jgi:hypothetical protein
MLIQPDINELGDQRLSLDEANIRERESLLKKASVHKISGQAELEDPDRAAGPRLNYREIIRRIQNINPSIQVREGSPGSVAIYRLKSNREIAEDVHETERTFFTDHVYVTGMEKDWLPEFAYVVLDTSNLPTREIRGWRSVLIALVKSRAISYASAVEAFGEPYYDQRSKRWYEQLNHLK